MNQFQLFNNEEIAKANFILSNKYALLSDLSSSELKDLAIVWCYYSGKIEGNTYTYVETEALLKDNITSPKSYEDAKMLKNLYNAFIAVLEMIQKEGAIMINSTTIFTIHSLIADELVENRNRGCLRNRAVKITGTAYVPPQEADEIEAIFNSIIENQNIYTNTLEKAIYLHCNLARLQPFIDGNKRTARLIESVVLMNNNLIPVYSAKDEDLLNYRKALIHYYDTKDYSQYITYFLDRLINRINGITPYSEVKFNLQTGTTEIQRRDDSRGFNVSEW